MCNCACRFFFKNFPTPVKETDRNYLRSRKGEGRNGKRKAGKENEETLVAPSLHINLQETAQTYPGV
jgi:hypothetical protein